MQVRRMPLDGVLVFLPEPHHDDRGFFTRTFDARIAREHGLAPEEFVQDSQSRSNQGTVRGLHLRGGRGEAKLVRCARGAVFDVLVDTRPDSPTFGQHMSITLDDTDFAHLYVPPGLLHGFQALTEPADICHRIDREHSPARTCRCVTTTRRWGIEWPRLVTAISARDLAAGSWADLMAGAGRAEVRS